MFTGLVEQTGKIRAKKEFGPGYNLVIEPENMWPDLQAGESISVSGCCLTVTEFDNKTFTVAVSQETVKRSTLGILPVGSFVNLERALRLSDRLGGHIVSGHVDCIGQVVSIVQHVAFQDVEFKIADAKFKKYVAEKGSITVDGVSLTVSQVNGDRFHVALIPFTIEHTTLKFLKSGSYVNLEFDILAKYVERLMGLDEGRGEDRLLDLLKREGFM